MLIRPYQPGDESAQVRIYNITASALPSFKPANVDEVTRRYRTADPDPAAKFYAVADGAVVGYAVYNPNGRISYPWCLPEHQDRREPLLEAVLSEMRRRGLPEAWAAYRSDWEPVIAFFREHGFLQARTMINYVAELAQLPHASVPSGQVIRPLERDDLPPLISMGCGIFADDDLAALDEFFWNNPFFDASSLFALTPTTDEGTLLGAALLIGAAGYADPTKIDPSMPCFRLGAMGTERERHKRVNGLFSCVFAGEAAGETLLAEAVRRLEQAGLTHLTAQAQSDQPALIAFYDRFLHRQGTFPILRRSIVS
jgi:L-amino acid N-acyltransferase YncA